MTESAEKLRRKTRQTSLRAEELDDALTGLVNNLRRDGYPVPIDTLAAATGIFLDEFARSPDDLSDLKYRLTPLFAKNAWSQKDIAQRIDWFVSERMRRFEPEPDETSPSAGDGVRTSTNRGGWIAAGTVVLLFVVAVFLVPRGIPSLEAPPTPHSLQQDVRSAPFLSEEAKDYPYIPKDSKVVEVPTYKFISYESNRSLRAEILIGGATAVPITITFLWWILRLQNRRRYMRLAGHDYDMPRYLARRFGEANLPISNQLGRAAAQMNSNAMEDYTELDVRRTVIETARNAGFLTTVEVEGGKDADYVVLIQRIGPNDHLARITEIILDRIEASGVLIRRYYYQTDPRQCTPALDTPRPIPFQDLARTFGRHRFLVVGATDGFFHPRTGDFLQWSEAEDVFLSKALLTARRPENWSYREEELERRGFFVSTASPTGIATYGAAVGMGRERMPQQTPPEFYGADVQGKALEGDRPLEIPPDRSVWRRLRRLRQRRAWERLGRDLRLLMHEAPADLSAFARGAVNALSRMATPVLISLLLVSIAVAGSVWMSGWDEPPVSVLTQNDSTIPRQHFERFRDCQVCPIMIALPGGVYTMGSPEGEAGRKQHEGPQRQVVIRAFALADTEVTFNQWSACAADGGCQSNPEPDDRGFGRGERPVINVSWDQAQEYIDWLNTKIGESEAQRGRAEQVATQQMKLDVLRAQRALLKQATGSVADSVCADTCTRSEARRDTGCAGHSEFCSPQWRLP